MATEVTLPEIGEGVEDVTISRWLVREGDSVSAGDPLLEIATDKVDTEIPTPVGGTVLAIHFGEGEIVDLHAVIAVIGDQAEEPEHSAFPPVRQLKGAHASAAEAPVRPLRDGAQMDNTEPTGTAEDEEIKATPVARRMAEEEGVPLSAVGGSRIERDDDVRRMGGRPVRAGGQITKRDVEAFLQAHTVADGGENADDLSPYHTSKDEDGARATSTPYDTIAPLEVRRLAAAYDIDLRDVAGERPLRTLTRHDLRRYAAEQKGLAHLAAGPNYPAQLQIEQGDDARQMGGRPVRPSDSPNGDRTRSAGPADFDTEPNPVAKPERSNETLVPHSRMRQIIARNMVQSAFSAPHVTTVHSVDMTAVTGHYQTHKGEAQKGARLTLTAYIVAAVVEGLKAVPAANAEWTEEGLLLKHAYHIGMAVALPADATGVGGLIVPVIRDAGDLNLMGIARQVADLAARARENRLAPADIQGGTFTLTNYGTSGSIFQTPVILQPQVAILGTGAIEKRPVVVSRGKPYEARVDDYLAFHPMMELALSYDHRVLDGASADAFCVAVKQTLEQWL